MMNSFLARRCGRYFVQRSSEDSERHFGDLNSGFVVATIANIAVLVFSFLFLQDSLAGNVQRINVFSYNLHNLFDPVHTVEGGVDKWDLQFVPLKTCLEIPNPPRSCGRYDWTPFKFKTKVSKIKEVFDLYRRSRKMRNYPHIAAFSEIESPLALKAVADSLGYSQGVITNSRDKRGIDVALLYRKVRGLNFKGHRVHHIGGVSKQTRPILEALFTVGSKRTPLFVFVNHWPSQMNGPKDRILPARTLMNIMAERRRQNPRAHFLALGDFNTLEVEDKDVHGRQLPHPFYDIMMKDPRLGMFDVEPAARKVLSRSLPPASYFYKRENKWNKLDRFFVSDRFKSGAELAIDLQTFDIFSPPQISRSFEGQVAIPREYKPKVNPRQQHPGYSDHYPIALDIVVR